MTFDLDKIAIHAAKLGFRTNRASKKDLSVEVAENIVLRFENLTEPEDIMMGFDGTPWHTHGAVTFEANDGWFFNLNEFELLSALRNGDVVIVDRLVSEELKDRWVAHKLEPFKDLKHIEPDEELRIRRLPKH